MYRFCVTVGRVTVNIRADSAIDAVLRAINVLKIENAIEVENGTAWDLHHLEYRIICKGRRPKKCVVKRML